MDGNTPAPGHRPPQELKVRTFNCPQCGGPLVIRGMRQTAAVVCPGCGSIIDISDENFKILDAFLSKVKHTPLIPLGTKGLLRNEKWEAIGFMRRCINVEGVDYRWSEYLLFNPYRGFRWLTEYNGHWNYVRQCLDRPRSVQDNVSYRGQTYKHFQQATAKVDYVLGEFYWLVETNDVCQINDFVSPPFMLSKEKTDDDVTWSLGEYILPDEIEKAFQLKGKLPGQVGVYANQPSPYREPAKRVLRTAAAFIALAILIQLLSVVFSQNKLVHQQAFTFSPDAAEKSLVTDEFDIEGRPSNVVIRSAANMNNAWIFLNMALINEATGTAYDLGRELSYYSGTDSDGNWSEGSNSDSVTIPAVPPGRYYLRVEPEGEAGANYSLRIYRDVPVWTHFLLALALLLLLPLIAWIRSVSFESRRWAESDHPWTTPGGEDDDD